MNPNPSDIIVLETPDSELVTTTTGAWCGPAAVADTEARAIRALRHLAARCPECYHCGPVREDLLDTYSGERYGRPFENRPLCEDCVAMLYRTAPEASLGEPDRYVETTAVDDRARAHRTLDAFAGGEKA